MSGFSIRFEYGDRVNDDFVGLARRLDAELSDRNGPWQAEYDVYNKLDGISGVVVAYEGDEAIGCAAMKPHQDGVFEVKRVYVTPPARERGLAKRLMARLESEGVARGANEFILETADTLSGALALYRSLGYGVIANYGPYRDKVHSVCFSKTLGTAFHIRRLGVDDLELLVRTRLDFCADDAPGTPAEELAALETETRRWFADHVPNETYLGYVGLSAGHLVCCAGMLLYSLPPIVGHPNRRQGHVLNFFTYPAFRRCGYGRRLMKHLIAEAPLFDVARLVLNATKAGEPLYREAGFHDPAGPNLVLELS